MFWGIVLTLLGLSIILNHLFKIDLPIIQIVIGGLLIYWGISWIFGSFSIDFKPRVTDSAAIFGKGNFSFPFDENSREEKKGKYEVVFGSGVVDLRGIDLSKGEVKIKIDTVFGETILLVDPETPYEIKSDTVFGYSSLPLENSSVIGSQKFQSKNYSKENNNLKIKASVVFGSLKVSSDPANVDLEGQDPSHTTY